MRRALARGALVATGAAGGLALAGALGAARDPAGPLPLPPGGAAAAAAPPPPRAAQLAKLAASTADDPFDVLIIGGGATGAGAAVDAAARGLRVALVERDDFGAGTSSRSTKLVHGGVRYLEKAFTQLDAGQLKLVFEALRERRTLLANAPHLARPLPIMTPCYSWWEVPYYWAGLKAYDAVAGGRGLAASYYKPPGRALATFPTLRRARAGDGARLKGAIVYYDGQFDDARLNVALAVTAARAGAAVANHARAHALLADPATGRVAGAAVVDELTGRRFDVHARAVVNATGPFADAVRRLGRPHAERMVMGSSGVHVTLPDYYSPEAVGMIVPKTRDGRVVFMLPWLGETIAGTTDAAAEPTARPRPTEAEVQFILDAIADHLAVRVRRSDVKSAWSGIRPLAADPGAGSTAAASRDHVVETAPDGLVTVAGGKWTTYRLMAEDAVDAALDAAAASAAARAAAAAPSAAGGKAGADAAAALARARAARGATERLPLAGAAGWHPALFTEVAQNYTVPHRPGAIDTRVAKHLAGAYGGAAREVTAIAEAAGLGRRLVRGYPVLEAEVVHAARAEYCESAEDFLARRSRLAFLDRAAAAEAAPRVVQLLAAEKGWGRRRARAELRRALEFLESFETAEEAGKPGAAARGGVAVGQHPGAHQAAR